MMSIERSGRPKHSSAKGIDLAMRLALGAVAAGGACLAWTALAGSFTTDSDLVRLGVAKQRSPLVVAGLLLQAVGCVLLLYSLRVFSAWRARTEMSEIITRDAERCGWHLKLRHSFGNRVQVALGLLALGRADEARDYLSQVSESLRAIGLPRYDPSCPELDRVLWQGVEAAKERGVEIVVLAWDSCHRLGVSMLAASQILGHALDLAVGNALSMRQRPVIYVRNSPGLARNTFLIEWDSSSVGAAPSLSVGGESPESTAPSGVCPSEALLHTRAEATAIASLAEDAKAAGGTLVFSADSERGFIQLAFPSIHVSDQE